MDKIQLPAQDESGVTAAVGVGLVILAAMSGMKGRLGTFCRSFSDCFDTVRTTVTPSESP
jgi:hypothetical protein